MLGVNFKMLNVNLNYDDRRFFLLIQHLRFTIQHSLNDHSVF